MRPAPLPTALATGMALSRELFPLPRPFPNALPPSAVSSKSSAGFAAPCRSVLKRIRKACHRQAWCNEAAETLNQLSGAPFSHPPTHATNHAQQLCINHLIEVFSAIPSDSFGLSPAGALFELCGSASRYDPVDCSPVAPYDKESISWPPVGSSPARVVDSLSGADRVLVDGWERHILKDAAARAAHRSSPDRARPFLEPTLVRNSSTYADFIQRLNQAGMLTFRVGGESLLGVFFVRKKMVNYALS